ncbi:hypothetical protein [Cyclobacterium plantarum]|uniref:Outer membrane protein beta-barrel domain-containing protein n=1 Tax=Cyclobacterium plantarum TaxID=2716263 RepID=A0ABX0H9Y2_9BACT|nr:hypothetical protein [Cyclobacterium plantarum]NHE56795.1 hypothetical protein [Cyclobacterium plantarum]
MQKFNLVLFLLLLFSWGESFGQSYGSSLGLRFGNNNQYRTIGLSVQQRIQKGLTVEGILQSDFNVNSSFHALLQKHRPILSKRLNYYYGAGISLGIGESQEKIPESMQIIQTYGNPMLGLDLVAGLEFTALGVNFSVDYKPNVNIAGRQPWYSGQVGISARSVLVKGKQQKKNRRIKAREKRKKNGTGFFQRIIQPFKNN